MADGGTGIGEGKRGPRVEGEGRGLEGRSEGVFNEGIREGARANW